MIILGIFIFLDYCHVDAQSTEFMHEKCGRVGNPLSIECNPGHVIYIRRTVISEFHDNTDTTCTLPEYNTYCHVFVNSTDAQYNGKQRTEYTFWKEELKHYSEKHGNCYGASMSKVVQISYQCLSSITMHSICQNLDIETNQEGFITSPNFPLPVNKPHESCSCEISTVYPAEVKLMAIIINPTATEMWSLTLSGSQGWAHDIGKLLLITTGLNYVTGQTMKLNFYSKRDTSYEPVYMPTIPPGFWIKFEASPRTAVVKLRCYSIDTTSNQVQRSMSTDAVYGIASCIIIVFILFMISVVYFIYHWRTKLYCGGKHSSDGSTTEGCTNIALSIEESVHNKLQVPQIHDTIDCYLKDVNDFEFNKLTKDGQLRYNTMPHRKRSYFDREQRFMSQRIIKAEIHKPFRKCSSINLSSVSVESRDTQTPNYQESTDKQNKVDADVNGTFSLDMFDFGVLYLEGATDIEIDV